VWDIITKKYHPYILTHTVSRSVLKVNPEKIVKLTYFMLSLKPQLEFNYYSFGPLSQSDNIHRNNLTPSSTSSSILTYHSVYEYHQLLSSLKDPYLKRNKGKPSVLS